MEDDTLVSLPRRKAISHEARAVETAGDGERDLSSTIALEDLALFRH